MPTPSRTEILAVTRDVRLFSSIRYAAEEGCGARWVRSAGQALEILESETNSILLFDWYSASQPWQQTTDRFLEKDPSCCIVLAAANVDEELWEQALGRGLYDVMPRTGPASVLAATLRFARQRQTGFSSGNRRKIMPGRDSGCLKPGLCWETHGGETADPRGGFVRGRRFDDGSDSIGRPDQRNHSQT